MLQLPNLAYNHFVETLFVLNDCQVGVAAQDKHCCLLPLGQFA